ncbi:MAG: calcium/sodium antiporter [Bacteriovoracaceae bacterium]|nr:calcium/sodium antiporter [Bacteriovoracaceae bacterium]
MLMYVLCVVLGLIALVWSADKFVDGSSGVAKYYGVPPLLIGMIIVGFGTSAPELIVSMMASYQGNSEIAMGNAVGSNITNIGLILGVTAILSPIAVNSQIVRREIPILIVVTIISILLILDYHLSRFDAIIHILLFVSLVLWTVKNGMQNKNDSFSQEMNVELQSLHHSSIKKSYFYLLIGLALLIISSRVLIYGAIGFATILGIPDTTIGLTIVAIGTSLPELASSIVASRKGEPDIALGNVIGSNLFNSLAVVGIAGTVKPLSFGGDIVHRDGLVMFLFTVLLFIFAYGFIGKGRINRIEGSILLITYIAYIGYLVTTTI